MVHEVNIYVLVLHQIKKMFRSVKISEAEYFTRANSIKTCNVVRIYLG